MLPHVHAWLASATSADAGALRDDARSPDRWQDPYPDPDSWFPSGISRKELKLASMLDFPIGKFAPESSSKRRRLRHMDEIPRDVKRHFAGFYLSHGLLSAEIAYRLSRLPIREIERFERVWLAVEDSLLLACPEDFILDNGRFVKTIFRWTVSKLVVSGYEQFLREYKRFVQFVKTRAIRANVETPGVPHFPYFTPEGVWSGSPCEWLNRVIRRGIKSKGEATRVAHLCSTRGLPPPTQGMILKSLLQHRDLLARPAPRLSEERLLIVRRLAMRIGRRINRTQVKHNLENPEHVSLTNSSSFAYSRTDGGRATEVQYEFIQWANSYGPSRYHVLGNPIPAGVNWLTVVHEPRSEDLSSYRFGDPLEGTILGDRRAGYDSNLGYQLLQCAAEAGQKRGVLDERYNVIGHPHVRASVSSEPGGKARIVTANEWWVTILLQPLGHVLTSLLEEIPSARAGLSRAEPAWEWVEDLQHAGKDPEKVESLYRGFGLLTSDLSEATDHCHRELSRQMLEGFFEGVGLSPYTGYLRTSIDLLVCRKILHSRS